MNAGKHAKLKISKYSPIQSEAGCVRLVGALLGINHVKFLNSAQSVLIQYIKALDANMNGVPELRRAELVRTLLGVKTFYNF